MKKLRYGRVGGGVSDVSDFEDAVMTACKRRGLTAEEIAARLGKTHAITAKTLKSLRNRHLVNALKIRDETRYFSAKAPYIKAVTAHNNARYAESVKRVDTMKIRWGEFTIAAQLKSMAYRDSAKFCTVKICGGCGMAVNVNEDVAKQLSGLSVTLPGYVEAHLGRFSPDAAFQGSYDASWFIEDPNGNIGVFCCCEACRLIMELLGPWFWAADVPSAGANTPLGMLLSRLLEIVVLRDENPRVKLQEGTRKFSLSKKAVDVLTVRARQVTGIAAAITARTTDSVMEVSPLKGE